MRGEATSSSSLGAPNHHSQPPTCALSTLAPLPGRPGGACRSACLAAAAPPRGPSTPRRAPVCKQQEECSVGLLSGILPTATFGLDRSRERGTGNLFYRASPFQRGLGHGAALRRRCGRHRYCRARGTPPAAPPPPVLHRRRPPVLPRLPIADEDKDRSFSQHGARWCRKELLPARAGVKSSKRGGRSRAASAGRRLRRCWELAAAQEDCFFGGCVSVSGRPCV